MHGVLIKRGCPHFRGVLIEGFHCSSRPQIVAAHMERARLFGANHGRRQPWFGSTAAWELIEDLSI